MGVVALSEVWDKSQAQGATLLVFLAFADYADEEGVFFPSEKTAAEKARCNEKTVRRAIQQLQATGELDVWEWYDKANGRRKNCYRITLGKFAAFRGVEPEDIKSRASVLRVNVPTATRRRIFERDHWTCVECGSKVKLVIDHIIPVTEGGGNEDENLRVLCSICNQRKASRLPESDESRVGEMSSRLLPAVADVQSQPGDMSGPHARDPGLSELQEHLNHQEEPSKDPRAHARENVRITWLSFPHMIQHRQSYFSEAGVKREIDKAVLKYTLDDVLRAIASYALIVDSPLHYFDHRWTLHEFLKRGLDRFVPEAEPDKVFANRSKSGGITPEQIRAMGGSR